MPYTLLQPCYHDGRGKHTLLWNGHAYSDELMEARIKTRAVGEGCEELCAVWRNGSGRTLRVQLEIGVQSDFAFTHYVIPGVSLSGNYWGRGQEPKGLALDGERWVFDVRRTTIPACTISENADAYLALMACCEDASSLRASCAMTANADGSMSHHLLYPMMEKPETYCGRDRYREAHEEWLTLADGEEWKARAYVLQGKPVCPNFAAANVEDAALDLLRPDMKPRYRSDEIRELCCLFAKQLAVRENGRWMFSIGRHWRESGRYELVRGYELGWCGQNALYARLLLEEGLKNGKDELAQMGISNLDAWSQEAVGPTGLIHAHYDRMLDGKSNVEDTCNQGFAICELVCGWETAKHYGLQKDEWLHAAKGSAAFLTAHWSDASGFGKAWDVETGVCVDDQGSIGAYVIPGLTALYRATGEDTWLAFAKKACAFYARRDLDAFQCTAGALDTYCIDKESSGPLLKGALDLYEITGEEAWLVWAKKAGWYFCSWMFHHDVPVTPGSDFDVYHYRTLGGSSVSAQHHHIDPWGALVAPQLMKLWRVSGDERWRTRARLLWANAIQNIAPLEGKEIHGHFREAGAQNEGYHHCCWGDEGAPGLINEWLVAWPQAYCWLSAAEEGPALDECDDRR